ncbi:sensor histidine kinase [Streptomyces sp. NPDC058964]|uniref:sensor histidine kinase n=1 Tax=Streptomyces sp. NPDC058964 TaxID=3346681 RepID=UPI003679AFF3
MTDENTDRPTLTEQFIPLARWRVPRTAVRTLLAWSMVSAAATVRVLSRPPGPVAVTVGLLATAVVVAVLFAFVPTKLLGRSHRLTMPTALVTAGTGLFLFLSRADGIPSAVAIGAFAVAGWALGCPVRAPRATVAGAVEHTTTNREHEERTRTAVVRERARIARELHDIVAHNVSLIVVQAAAADRVRERDPDRIRELHATIEETGRATVVELRRLLEVLRTEEETDAEGTSEHGIEDIPRLLDAVREAGLRVRWTSSGTARPVPAGTGHTAYRIVQEALTNSLKHAGLARALVTLDWQDSRLTVTVHDDGRPPGSEAPPLPAGGRHGLVGMRERVAAVGGTLHTGPRPEGGFLVRAALPLPRPS